MVFKHSFQKEKIFSINVNKEVIKHIKDTEEEGKEYLESL